MGPIKLSEEHPKRPLEVGEGLKKMCVFYVKQCIEEPRSKSLVSSSHILHSSLVTSDFRIWGYLFNAHSNTQLLIYY